MKCEHAYYFTAEKYAKPYCNNKQRLAEESAELLNCPLIYYCPVSERFENSEAMFRCKYRGKQNDGQ